FISPTRVQTYRRHFIAGATYMLQNFFATKSKEIYRVAEQGLTISFFNDSVLSPLDGDDDSSNVSFPSGRFHFHTHAEFQANVGLRGDLHDIVGHLKLVNGQALMNRPILDEADMISMGHILLYLWDASAREFYMKFTSSEDTPTVLMVTTLCVIPHIEKLMEVSYIEIGFGNLALSSMSSSRVFLDKDIHPTIEYFNWDNLRDRAWYYIACSGCQTKATKGPSSLMCAKCGKNNVSDVAKYLAKISVYDNNDQSLFVLLGDAGTELTGKPAADLVDKYFEELGAGHQMSAPQVLIDTIGQTYNFKMKVLSPLPNSSEFPVIVEDEAPLPLASVSDASGYNAGDGTEGTNNKDEAQMAKRD
ncbi:hypothetical protein N665_0057s0004, partial [Sinapis alba]